MSTNNIVCPNCQTENSPSEQFCNKCGLWIQDVETSKTIFEKTGNVLRANIRQILHDLDKPEHPPDLKDGQVGLAIAGDESVLVIDFTGPIILGRDTGQTAFEHPIIDFNDYRGYKMGVSRKHALISSRGGIFTLTDLGSSNGTFLNGQQIQPNTPIPITNGDHIALGKLEMFFYCK
jgi:hypothetical protein